MSMSGNSGITERPSPFWLPWLVPRVARSSAPPITVEAQASMVARLVKRRKLTPMQRVLAIHIINATYPTDTDLV